MDDTSHTSEKEGLARAVGSDTGAAEGGSRNENHPLIDLIRLSNRMCRAYRSSGYGDHRTETRPLVPTGQDQSAAAVHAAVVADQAHRHPDLIPLPSP